MFVGESFAGQYAAQGFEERLYRDEAKAVAAVNPDESPGETIAKQLHKSGLFCKQTPLEKFLSALIQFKNEENYERLCNINKQLVDVIQQVGPDLFVVDDLHLLPAIHYSRVPWIRNNSIMPLWGQDHPCLPPPCLGELRKRKQNHIFSSFLPRSSV